jgi:hypothetical protein
VRAADHRLYCPPEPFARTRHQYVVFEARSVGTWYCDAVPVRMLTSVVEKFETVDT